jgi:dipeptidyl aminopeptidase/acylaminoacyl peptidase
MMMNHRGQRTFLGHTNLVSSVSFSPDGKRIASGSTDGTVKVWDAASGQDLLTLKGHTRAVWSVSFSPDGKRIASGSGGFLRPTPGEVKVWDAASGQELLTLKGDTVTVNSVSFSPDGKRIASGSHDKTVKVWDAASGQELLTLKGHTHGVSSVSFSPDGKRIASGSGEFLRPTPAEVKVWDAASGQDLLTLKGHTGGVNSVSFSPDGKRIASREDNGKQITWDLATGQPVADRPGERWLASSPRSPGGELFAHVEGDVIRLHRLHAGKEAEDGRFRWWIDPDYRWHEAEAQDSWREGDWFAAAFHLERVLQERPSEARLYVLCAHALRQLNRDREATIHTLRALLLHPTVSWKLPPAKERLLMPRVEE